MFSEIFRELLTEPSLVGKLSMSLWSSTYISKHIYCYIIRMMYNVGTLLHKFHCFVSADITYATYFVYEVQTLFVRYLHQCHPNIDSSQSMWGQYKIAVQGNTRTIKLSQRLPSWCWYWVGICCHIPWLITLYWNWWSGKYT